MSVFKEKHTCWKKSPLWMLAMLLISSLQASSPTARNLTGNAFSLMLNNGVTGGGEMSRASSPVIKIIARP
jgi:hypothetical protein